MGYECLASLESRHEHDHDLQKLISGADSWGISLVCCSDGHSFVRSRPVISEILRTRNFCPASSLDGDVRPRPFVPSQVVIILGGSSRTPVPEVNSNHQIFVVLLEVLP